MLSTSERARTKGIVSPVAGNADILVAPNIDAGNMLAKQLTYIAKAEAAGVVIGALVPIILNSRSDGDTARLASCAVAALHEARGRRRGQTQVGNVSQGQILTLNAGSSSIKFSVYEAKAAGGLASTRGQRSGGADRNGSLPCGADRCERSRANGI